jgi:hypothetical protein
MQTSQLRFLARRKLEDESALALAKSLLHIYDVLGRLQIIKVGLLDPSLMLCINFR